MRNILIPAVILSLTTAPIYAQTRQETKDYIVTELNALRLSILDSPEFLAMLKRNSPAMLEKWKKDPYGSRFEIAEDAEKRFELRNIDTVTSEITTIFPMSDVNISVEDYESPLGGKPSVKYTLKATQRTGATREIVIFPINSGVRYRRTIRVGSVANHNDQDKLQRIKKAWDHLARLETGKKELF